MKRIIILTALLALVAIPAFANPNLTCDCSNPADAITNAQVQIDGGAWVTAPLVQTCGSLADKVICTAPAVTICYDMASVAPGAHTAKAHWSNSQGRVSADAGPLSLTILGTPSMPTSQKLVVQ